MQPIVFEHPLRDDVRYVVYPDPKDPGWFMVETDEHGEENWQRLEKNPDVWENSENNG